MGKKSSAQKKTANKKKLLATIAENITVSTLQETEETALGFDENRDKKFTGQNNCAQITTYADGNCALHAIHGKIVKNEVGKQQFFDDQHLLHREQFAKNLINIFTKYWAQDELTNDEKEIIQVIKDDFITFISLGLAENNSEIFVEQEIYKYITNNSLLKDIGQKIDLLQKTDLEKISEINKEIENLISEELKQDIVVHNLEKQAPGESFMQKFDRWLNEIDEITINPDISSRTVCCLINIHLQLR